MNKYKGTIVQESLVDDQILNEFEVLGYKVTDEDNPESRWHLFTVNANKELIEKLSDNLKPEKWYAYFWSGDDVMDRYPLKCTQFLYN